ncbi:unnamed protein product [Linum tenue]|uniref:Uncharacterized protein n=1 Tax=Linum tenue TaxID=586396 RepID=A0AAV0IQG8_9ROSI|nr:unnamed protein product [Linum tenue]
MITKFWLLLVRRGLVRPHR